MSYSANGTIDECSSVSSRSRTRVSPGDPLVFRGSTIGRSGSDARGGSDLMKAYGSNSSVTYASARLCCTASSCAASASASAATAACASAAARSAAAAAAAATRCAVASRVSRCGESASEAFCAASFWPKIEWKTGEKIESSSDPVRGDMAVCCGVGPSPLTCTLIGVEGAPDAPIPGGAGLLRGEDVMKACGVAAGGLLGSLAVAAPLCSGVLFGGSPPSPSPSPVVCGCGGCAGSVGASVGVGSGMEPRIESGMESEEVGVTSGRWGASEGVAPVWCGRWAKRGCRSSAWSCRTYSTRRAWMPTHTARAHAGTAISDWTPMA
mmetsp:Transcript_29523/g.69082  ORF Transcript_29523/g.69082 Transcript_29523/m.69082 type:complete len:324 (-) Transcript_29523:756-1727(-)